MGSISWSQYFTTNPNIRIWTESLRGQKKIGFGLELKFRPMLVPQLNTFDVSYERELFLHFMQLIPTFVLTISRKVYCYSQFPSANI